MKTSSFRQIIRNIRSLIASLFKVTLPTVLQSSVLVLFSKKKQKILIVVLFLACNAFKYRS
ncbi:hypothetical protein CW304_14465 [Bacillus sp. UFRGS-B20]|nr:hypothetical protein CW304_14465 [Bacillus sp. UFRGS-B20]